MRRWPKEDKRVYYRELVKIPNGLRLYDYIIEVDRIHKIWWRYRRRFKGEPNLKERFYKRKAGEIDPILRGVASWSYGNGDNWYTDSIKDWVWSLIPY